MNSKKTLYCDKCKIDCYNDIDYFMVKNSLWKKYGIGEGILCFDCLQKRMGRSIVKKDLTGCPVNECVIRILKVVNNIKWEL